MRSLPLQKAIGLAIAALALSACAGGGGTPTAPTALQAPSIAAGDDAAIRNVSGQYAGTVKDSERGKGSMKLDLAQYRNAVGGSIKLTEGTQSETAGVTYVLSATALHGSGVTMSSSATCVFSETATYDPSTKRLTGSYHSFRGCGTEKGTFDVKQRCYYARDWGVRNDAGGVKQC